MTDTPIDTAYARFAADPENETLRRAYFACVMRSEVHLLLSKDPGDTLDPVLIEDDGQTFALGFDTAERLVAFTETASPSAIMAGRDALALLNEAKLGLGLNLGVAASAYLLPSDVAAWLANVADGAETAAPASNDFALPHADQDFLNALDMFLAGLGGQATTAHFAQNPPSTPVVMFSGQDQAAEAALTHATAEFFALIGAAPVAVVFADRFPHAQAVQDAGLTFNLPELPQMQPPGGDPTKPPRLR